ncbi:MAG: hypothetical protein HC888_08720 [Candidatus Competibacteraceae bacterium]|nr:hypothetical protein [Candidatus Competibacteraceae bacterium]
MRAASRLLPIALTAVLFLPAQTGSAACAQCPSSIPSGASFVSIASCGVTGRVLSTSPPEIGEPYIAAEIGCGSCSSKTPVDRTSEHPIHISNTEVVCVSASTTFGAAPPPLVFTGEIGGQRCWETPGVQTTINLRCKTSGCSRQRVFVEATRYTIKYKIELKWTTKMYVRYPGLDSFLVICPVTTEIKEPSQPGVILGPDQTQEIECGIETVINCACSSS